MNYFEMLDRGRKAAIYAYLHAQAQAQNFGRGAAGGEGSSAKEEPPAPPTPPEPTIYDMTWDFIHNEATWDAAYNREGSPLKKYYEAHPEEDLWNVEEGRAVNFNDRKYIGIFNGEEISCGTTWATEKSQKLELNGDTYYCEIWGYNLDPKTVELFDDPSLEVPTGQTFEITKVSFSDDCKHCWDGTINAPGAKLPWAVIDTSTPHDLSKEKAKIEFQYEGNTVYPCGDAFRNFSAGYVVASIPVELKDFGVQAIDPKNQEQTDTFDDTKLSIKGYIE